MHKHRIADTQRGICTEVLVGPEYCTYLLQPHSDTISDNILESGRWEWNLIKLSEKFLPNNGVFLDIGANIGVWSCELSKKCKKVISFEPQLMTYNLLCANLFINNCKNVIPYRYGLTKQSEHGSNMHLLVMDKVNNNGGSRIINRDNIRITSEIGNNAMTKIRNVDYNIKETVKILEDDGFEIQNIDMISVDSSDIFDDINVNLIKIDVEGHEHQVIEGMELLIKRDKPVIFMEIWKMNVTDMSKLMTKNSYRVFHISGDDYICIHEQDQENFNRLQEILRYGLY